MVWACTVGEKKGVLGGEFANTHTHTQKQVKTLVHSFLNVTSV